MTLMTFLALYVAVIILVTITECLIERLIYGYLNSDIAKGAMIAGSIPVYNILLLGRAIATLVRFSIDTCREQFRLRANARKATIT